jgi:hypothetical protein
VEILCAGLWNGPAAAAEMLWPACGGAAEMLWKTGPGAWKTGPAGAEGVWIRRG